MLLKKDSPCQDQIDSQHPMWTFSKHVYLNIKLFAGRQVCKLWRIVIDVSDQDVNSGCGIETRVTLVCHHHLQTVLAVLLPVQCHPVDDFTWKGCQTGSADCITSQ